MKSSSPVSFEDPGVNVKVFPGSTVAQIGFDVPVEELKTSSLRSLAKMTYVTSQQGISLADLSQIYPFNRVHISTLSKWSTSDNWVEERERYRTSLENKIFQKLEKSHVQAISEQLKGLDDIASNMHKILNPLRGFSEVGPNSYEGMVNALVRLEKFRFEARKEIADRVKETLIEAQDKEGISSKDGVEVPKIQHSKEDIRRAAIAIIKARRNK